MAYIYKITNNTNGKIYIGKTNRTIEVRWREHCKDFIAKRKQHLPLYRAFEKYGLENFTIEEVEQCLDTQAEEREKYWIEKLRSFREGYNATIGGDGRPYIDYDLVCALYEETKNQREVARRMNIDRATVHYILEEREVSLLPTGEITRLITKKMVKCYDKNGNFIQIFDSITDGAKWIIEKNHLKTNLNSVKTNIGRCLNGTRKTCYSYIWKEA
jgi:predicted GIY-YIG superfamily endonuclease